NSSTSSGISSASPTVGPDSSPDTTSASTPSPDPLDADSVITSTDDMTTLSQTSQQSVIAPTDANNTLINSTIDDGNEVWSTNTDIIPPALAEQLSYGANR